MAERAVGEFPIPIEDLSPEEQLALLERLWERLSLKPESVPVTPAQRAELDQRLADLGEDSTQGHPLGVPWNEVVRQLRTRV